MPGSGTDSEIFLKGGGAVHGERIDQLERDQERLERGQDQLWDHFDRLRTVLTNHRVQTALIQGGAVVINALVIYLVTRH